MKIAVDNQISKETIDKLNKKYKVIVCAEDLPDDIWIDMAIANKCDVIISPDLDIPNYLDKIKDCNIIWLDLPQNLKSKEQYSYINDNLRKLIK